MSKNIAMGIGAFAAMAFDFVIVASILGLLLLTRWIGLGWILDLMTVLGVSYVVIAWFYGKRFVKFLDHLDNESSHRATVGDPVAVVAVTAQHQRSNLR
jgi:hypothetical protein